MSNDTPTSDIPSREDLLRELEVYTPAAPPKIPKKSLILAAIGDALKGFAGDPSGSYGRGVVGAVMQRHGQMEEARKHNIDIRNRVRIQDWDRRADAAFKRVASRSNVLTTARMLAGKGIDLLKATGKASLADLDENDLQLGFEQFAAEQDAREKAKVESDQDASDISVIGRMMDDVDRGSIGNWPPSVFQSMERRHPGFTAHMQNLANTRQLKLNSDAQAKAAMAERRAKLIGLQTQVAQFRLDQMKDFDVFRKSVLMAKDDAERIRSQGELVSRGARIDAAIAKMQSERLQWEPLAEPGMFGESEASKMAKDQLTSIDASIEALKNDRKLLEDLRLLSISREVPRGPINVDEDPNAILNDEDPNAPSIFQSER